jgi:hypothetical protein
MLQITRDDGVLRIGSDRNLLVAGWTNSPEADHLRALGDEAQKLARAYPKGSALLNVLIRGTPKFHDRVREEAVKVITEPTNFPLGAGHVIMVDGLAGAAIRAFLSTIMLIGRGHRPRKVFADPREAASWIARNLSFGPETWTADAVHAAHVALLEHR